MKFPSTHWRRCCLQKGLVKMQFGVWHSLYSLKIEHLLVITSSAESRPSRDESVSPVRCDAEWACVYSVNGRSRRGHWWGGQSTKMVLWGTGVQWQHTPPLTPGLALWGGALLTPGHQDNTDREDPKNLFSGLDPSFAHCTKVSGRHPGCTAVSLAGTPAAGEDSLLSGAELGLSPSYVCTWNVNISKDIRKCRHTVEDKSCTVNAPILLGHITIKWGSFLPRKQSR